MKIISTWFPLHICVKYVQSVWYSRKQFLVAMVALADLVKSKINYHDKRQCAIVSIGPVCGIDAVNAIKMLLNYLQPFNI